MLVDNLDAQVSEAFQKEMSSHDTQIISLPPRSTSFAQPVDRHFGVRIKKLVKKEFRALLEKQHAKFEKGRRTKKLTTSDIRLAVSRWLADAWEEVIKDKQFMADTFKRTGLSLAIDGSQDDQINIPGVKKLVMQ